MAEMPGERLKDLREKTGLSQKGLADLAGVSQSAIARYENGRTEATYDILIWLADYYDVSTDYILCRTENPQGKLYTCATLQKKEMESFVQACFDETSTIGKQIKEQLVTLWMEQQQTLKTIGNKMGDKK
ncbi:MAG: helix-turn-helix transcriptional regulator [Christensenella sp.]|uniref:helix-turn-helix domain-containing protein n=1 Tax=Christensenella sp. TaxID=1935934 RepID=UPI002B203126|nr:helix-turn-helix transcriptional regulator [Christensenella sp.]MEA5004417.1 helix-turn-helix transcriptional regulator [Christensenella sp.]